MPIVGIDYNKCILCKNCLKACTEPEAYFKFDSEKNKVIFEDPNKQCIQCGQCIAQCPEDAIIYEAMGESFIFDEIQKLPELIDHETLFKFLAANRSVRFYKQEKVPEELLRKVIRAMEQAPTAANMRSENFYVLSDTEQIQALASAIYEDFINDPAEKEHWLERKERYGKTNRDPVFYNAPHIIIITSNFNMLMEGFNIGIIATYGRLAAQALGLGTCWIGYITLAFQRNPKLKKMIKLRGSVFGGFTLGYPDVKFYRVPPRPPKKVRGLS
ncbi:MAG: nitroreductase family protein [Promethearchaeota archaeon]